jgi:hypothetical protein
VKFNHLTELSAGALHELSRVDEYDLYTDPEITTTGTSWTCRIYHDESSIVAAEATDPDKSQAVILAARIAESHARGTYRILAQSLSGPRVFKAMASYSDDELRRSVGAIMREKVGSPTTIAEGHRIIQIVMYELNRRENEREGAHTKWYAKWSFLIATLAILLQIYSSWPFAYPGKWLISTDPNPSGEQTAPPSKPDASERPE